MESSLSQVAGYRREFRAANIGPRYRGLVHACFTFGLGTAVIVVAAMSLRDVRPLEWLTVPLTFLYANLAEYFGHRGPMHHPRRGLRIIYERHAGQHHRFFTSENMALEGTRDLKVVLFPILMIAFFLLCFALPVGLLLGWLATSNVAWLFVLTAVAYFLNYEALHLIYHLPTTSAVGRLPLVARLRWLHQLHHDTRLMAHYNFNITYPIGDLLFGTLWRERDGARRVDGPRSAGTQTRSTS
jgi:hypothetical protein